LYICTCQILLAQLSNAKDRVSVRIHSEFTTKRLLTKKCNIFVTSLYYYSQWKARDPAKASRLLVAPDVSFKISRLMLNELQRNEFKLADEFIPSIEDQRYSFHLDVMVQEGKNQKEYDVLIEIKALYHNPDRTIVPSDSWSAFFVIDRKLLDRNMRRIVQKMVETFSFNSGEYTIDLS
jgi:hypothetical protein